MVGLSRFVRFVERISPFGAGCPASVRSVTVLAVLAGLVLSTCAATPFPSLLGTLWPAAEGVGRDEPLLRALGRIPAEASFAATPNLIAESSSRNALYAIVTDVSNFRTVLARRPDYIAITLRDIEQAPRAGFWVASLLCRGTYGIVYRDRGAKRMVLARGALLSANQSAYKALFAPPRRECPAAAQDVMDSELFARAARLETRAQTPSVAGPRDMFAEPVAALPGGRFSQEIHLPDQRFDPGWYRLDLVGAWPWTAASAYKVSTKVLVGDRAVGETVFAGDRPLRYDTPPFRVATRATLPVRIHVEMSIPEGPAEPIWALRPTRQACAVVADAKDLNPRQITVQARIYLEELPPLAGPEAGAPILNKNNESGYELRLARDNQGTVWADFGGAGQSELVRAGPAPVHDWTVITATYDERGGAVYVNGLEPLRARYRIASAPVPMRSSGAPLVIGCREPGRGAAAVFPGLIESVAVWNRVLTPAEIQESAAAWSLRPMETTGLIGSWNFFGPPRSGAADLSGAGHPVTNPADLVRMPALDTKGPLAAWRSRQLSLLQTATIRRVASPP